MGDHLIDVHHIDLACRRYPAYKITMYAPASSGSTTLKASIDDVNVRSYRRQIYEGDVCADSGTWVSMIDHDLALPSLGLPARRTALMKLQGIGNGSTVTKYVTFHLKVSCVDEPLDITANLVSPLRA